MDLMDPILLRVPNNAHERCDLKVRRIISSYH